MALSLILLLSLVVSAFAANLGALQANPSICLYSGATAKTLRPLQIRCPSGTTNCMNTIYKYSNFQYNGIASLKPNKGEVATYLAQDGEGKIDMVIMVNANLTVSLQVYMAITGADPTGILLYDDPAPSDKWTWANNKGNFTWTTQPGYTDGVVVGHINFIDNYCVKMSFTQPNAAVNTISILSGNTSKVDRVYSVPYVSGQTFEYCQYPVTGQTYSNATCPGRNNGFAFIWIIFGPSNVQYTWFDSANNQVATTANATNLGAGIYRVFVTDPSANGCNAERTVHIFDNTLNGAIVSTTPFDCSTKGTATATPDGGSSGFMYTWYKVGQSDPLGTGNSISGLDQGNYYVRVMDDCDSVADTYFTIGTTGCCGDGICQTTKNETCGSNNYCAADCGVCCPAGTYISGAMCVVCPPGSLSTTIQSTECTPCPANKYNAGGAEPCSSCPDNHQSIAGSGKCVRCPAGSVRASSGGSCNPCAAGSYAPACDASACTDCPAGTISAAGATFCTTCPAGTFSASGDSTCQTCAMNSYSMAGSSSCTACPSGTATMMAGATHMLACN